MFLLLFLAQEGRLVSVAVAWLTFARLLDFEKVLKGAAFSYLARLLVDEGLAADALVLPLLYDSLLLLHHADHAVIIQHLMGCQVLRDRTSIQIVLDLGMPGLARPFRQVVLVIRDKLGLVLWPKYGLFIQHLVLHLDFVVLVLLPFAEKALLYAQPLLFVFFLRSVVDDGDCGGFYLPFDLIDAFFLEISANLLVIARNGSFVIGRQILPRLGGQTARLRQLSFPLP